MCLKQVTNLKQGSLEDRIVDGENPEQVKTVAETFNSADSHVDGVGSFPNIVSIVVPGPSRLAVTLNSTDSHVLTCAQQSERVGE